MPTKKKNQSPSKTSAVDRTIGLFSGVSGRLEYEAPRPDLEITEEEKTPKAPFNGIDGEVERWRNQAFQGQEWTTKIFYQGDRERHQEATSNGFGEYRLSSQDGWMYLESLRLNTNGTKSRSYSGVMFPMLDYWNILEVFLKSSMELDKEKLKTMLKELFK